MPLLTNLSAFNTPGVYIQEDTAGSIPSAIASHNTAYMLIYSSKVGAPTENPIWITSYDDYLNVFGTTQSNTAIKAYFMQRPRNGIYLINVVPRASKPITIATVTPGTAYSLTIAGTVFSYTAVTGDTSSVVISKLADLILQGAKFLARINGTNITYKTGTVITPSAGITLGTEVVAAAYPTVTDVLDTLEVSFTSELPQGFLLAPEFFAAQTTVSSHNQLANGLINFCADPRFYWVALIDCRTAVANATNPSDLIQLAKAERTGLSSPKGHGAYYVPYLKLDDNGTTVNCPPSPFIAALAIKRYQDQNFSQPPAGTKYPLVGVTGVTVRIDDSTQGQLNPSGINCIRELPNRGIVAYGARTLSTSPYYKFLNTRVIFNVLAGSFRGVYDEEIFSAVDGLGILFARIKGTAVSICERLRKAGALYGESSGSNAAYLVICDSTNNDPAQLENGIVQVDVLAKPSPTAEIIAIRLTRVAIGENLESIVEANLVDPTSGQPISVVNP